MTFRERLIELKACSESIEWVGDRSSAQAWAECERSDWMLWLAKRADIGQRACVVIACECARLVLHLVPMGDDRPRLAIEEAEAWLRGEEDVVQVLAAADAADAAYAAADAAYAAAYAADYAAAYATRQQCCDIIRKHINAGELKL
jgi:hypothetical protein